MPTRRQVLECPVDAVTLEQAVSRVALWVDSGEKRRGCAINAHKLAKLANDATLRDEVFSADLIVADGTAVLLAARITDRPLPARVTGVDLMEALLVRANDRHWRVYLLGTTSEILADGIKELQRRLPGIALVGAHSGFFDDPEKIAREIACTRPDLLFVAMGTPKQEHFLRQWGSVCDAGFAMGVGGAIDVLAGAQPRAPRWLQDHGLEWAWRVGRQPTLRWRRLLDPLTLIGRATKRRWTT